MLDLDARKTGEKIFFMRKIAVVIPKYGLVGGAEQFASELTNRLSKHPDYSFHIFANRWQPDSDTFQFQKIPVITFPKFLTTLSFAWFVRNRLRRDDFSLVHSHERIFAADIYTLHGVPHRYWVDQVRCKKMSLFDRTTAWVERKLVYEGHCQRFVAVSHLTKEIFLNEYPVHPDRVCVIHPGVDLSGYASKNKDDARHAVRSRLQIGDNDVVIIFASMNFEIKGLDHILLSLAKLQKQGKKIKLIVAGKGNAKKYQRMAKEAGIADQIIFAGVVSRDQLVDLYLAGDLYMMLSRFDTFGMVVPEAMAAGLPVLISSHVGAKDLVQEGRNGFMIENPSDHDYITSRLEILLNEQTRKTMSAAAVQTAAQNTWDRVAKLYQDLYADVLAVKREKG